MRQDVYAGDFGPVKKDSAPDQIANRILTMIKQRRLRPGDKLPAERELALVMGVSRPTLRAALQALSLLNIIEMRQGDGNYVSSLEIDLLMEHLDLIFELDDTTFLELFAVRKILEVDIAALAANHASDEDIQQLEEITACAGEAEVAGDRESFLQLDLAFHQQIAVMARNRILKRFMDAVSRLGVASRRRTAQLPTVMARTREDHSAILAALKLRDPLAARQAMLNHLNHVERKLEQALALKWPSSALPGTKDS